MNLIILFLVFAHIASIERYVSQEGKDEGNCTKTSPCLTVPYAFNIINQNHEKVEELIIKKGTYEIDVPIIYNNQIGNIKMVTEESAQLNFRGNGKLTLKSNTKYTNILEGFQIISDKDPSNSDLLEIDGIVHGGSIEQITSCKKIAKAYEFNGVEFKNINLRDRECDNHLIDALTVDSCQFSDIDFMIQEVKNIDIVEWKNVNILGGSAYGPVIKVTNGTIFFGDVYIQDYSLTVQGKSLINLESGKIKLVGTLIHNNKFIEGYAVACSDSSTIETDSYSEISDNKNNEGIGNIYCGDDASITCNVEGTFNFDPCVVKKKPSMLWLWIVILVGAALAIIVIIIVIVLFVFVFIKFLLPKIKLAMGKIPNPMSVSKRKDDDDDLFKPENYSAYRGGQDSGYGSINDIEKIAFI